MTASGPGQMASFVLRHIAATERWKWAENVCLRPSRYPGQEE